MSAAITVIIAVRNGAATLAAALESVTAQRLPDGLDAPEILVIDGGSTDGSDRIAASHPAVTLIRQASTGLAGARNEAIRAAHGSMLAFCDADDRWTADSLAARLRALDANADAIASIGHAALCASEGGPPTAAQQSRIGTVRAGFTPGCMLVRRSAFERVGMFDETLRIGADSEWFVRLRQSGLQVAMVDATVLLKGARNTSLSADVAAYRKELLDIGRRFIRRHKKDRQP
jgi:glycosyltransferase involved in cell wall biosynthesis